MKSYLGIFVFFVGSAFGGINQLSAQTVEGQQEVEIIVDNDDDGKANSGDILRYRIIIQNTGDSDAEGVQLILAPDGRTLLVPGSFRSSPVAMPDSYLAIGNVDLEVPETAGLMANDFDDSPDMLTITQETKATSEGGTVEINADGSFSYTPPTGFTGEDTFTYELNDGTPVDGAPDTDTGTVTITVDELIWFIDNSEGGTGGTGTLSDPFLTLGDFNSSALPDEDHLIFISHTGTDYTGGMSLQNGQIIFGSGHSGGDNLEDVLPFTLPPHTVSLPSLSGDFPVVTNVSGDCFTLAEDNSLRGFNIGACSGFGISNNETDSVGDLVVSEVSINNTTGGGFRAGNGTGSDMIAVFSAISSSGGVNGINLTDGQGTFTVNGGTITNPTGTSVLISGGSVAFTSSGVISDNSGFAVDLSSHSGNVTFSGNITSTGTGIRVQNNTGGTKTFSGAVKSLNTGSNTAVALSNNTGAVISFTNGGLAVNTTSGTGFSATGGGTAAVTGSENTLSATTGSALNVTNTTIGTDNLTFQSVSSNGGSSTGIILSNTGTSGGLIVTGAGTAGSGGTIANKTGADALTNQGVGIYLNQTGSVELSRMQLNDFSNYAILGQDVTDFDLTHSVINGSNGTNIGSETGDMNTGVDQGSVRFQGLTGEALIANSSISGGIKDNFWVQNTSGTLDRIVFDNVTMGLHSTSDGNKSLRLIARGTSVFNATVINSDFEGSRGDQIDFRAESSGNAELVFTDNTIVNNHPDIATGGGGVTLIGGENGNFNLQFEDNTLRDAMGSALLLVKTIGNGQITGSIANNVVGVSGIANSGSLEGSGIQVRTNGGGTMNVAITNNEVYQYNNYGIFAQAGTGTVQSGNLNVNVTGNVIASPGNNSNIDGIFQGLFLNSGVTPGDSFQVCFDAQNNTMTNSGRNGSFDARLRQRQSTTVRLPGYTGGATDTGAVQSYLFARNVFSTGGHTTDSPPGGGFTGGAICF